MLTCRALTSRTGQAFIEKRPTSDASCRFQGTTSPGPNTLARSSSSVLVTRRAFDSTAQRDIQKPMFTLKTRTAACEPRKGPIAYDSRRLWSYLHNTTMKLRWSKRSHIRLNTIELRCTSLRSFHRCSRQRSDPTAIALDNARFRALPGCMQTDLCHPTT